MRLLVEALDREGGAEALCTSTAGPTPAPRAKLVEEVLGVRNRTLRTY